MHWRRSLLKQWRKGYRRQLPADSAETDSNSASCKAYAGYIMAEPTAFSSSGEDVITRGLSITPAAGTSNVPNPTTREELEIVENLYEVEWTAKEIVEAEYKQVI